MKQHKKIVCGMIVKYQLFDTKAEFDAYVKLTNLEFKWQKLLLGKYFITIH